MQLNKHNQFPTKPNYLMSRRFWHEHFLKNLLHRLAGNNRQHIFCGTILDSITKITRLFPDLVKKEWKYLCGFGKAAAKAGIISIFRRFSMQITTKKKH